MAASVHTVKKCRKSPGDCGRCGRTIKKGEPYIHWKFRYGGKRVRCLECPCKRAASRPGTSISSSAAPAWSPRPSIR